MPMYRLSAAHRGADGAVMSVVQLPPPSLAFPASGVPPRVRGLARYTADLVTPDTVLVGLARSPYAHARVSRLDTRRALKTPGVLGVLTPADFDGITLGHQIADEPVLTNVARYVGDGIAAVAATDQSALVRGIEALDIDYEILPHACSVDDALTLGEPLHRACPDNVAQRFSIERGNWEAAQKRVSFWVTGTFQTQAVPHAYLEPRATLVRVTNERLELVTASHFPAVLVETYREIVADWGASLEVITPDIGGSFGAKWEHPTHLICLAFAHRLRRNVAMVLSRRDDMIAGRTRVAMKIWMRIGATDDGELVAKETVLWADNGAYSGHGPTVSLAAATRMDNLYRFSALNAQAQLVYTNNMPSECFRGFGSPQSAFAQEQLIDELAERLSMDPIELRRRNAVQPQDTTLHGWQVGSCGFAECLDAVRQRVQAHRDDHPLPASSRYRFGYGVAAGTHGISNRGYDHRFDRALLSLRLEPDGMLCAGSAEVEIGCGTVDLVCTLIADYLELDRERIRIVLGDTATVPHGLGSFASRTAFFAGRAALDASRQFAKKCSGFAAEAELPAEAGISAVIDVAVAAGRTGELCVTGCYEPEHVALPDQSGYGNTSPAYTFGAHGCCVRVDMATGLARVIQYWAAHDTGRVLSPKRARGQVVGGVHQGLGFALAETALVDDQGRLQNPGYLDDRVATFADTVPVECIFASTFEEHGPNGAKSIAEPPIIPVAACVANAIYDAIGTRQRRLPMTPERVWRSLHTEG